MATAPTRTSAACSTSASGWTSRRRSTSRRRCSGASTTSLRSCRRSTRSRLNHPAMVRYQGRPVIFFWARQHLRQRHVELDSRQVDPEHRAVWIADGDNFGIVGGDAWDGISPYAIAWSGNPARPAAALGHHGAVGGARQAVDPGGVARLRRFGGARDTCLQDRAGGEYYQATWDGALASNPSWAVIVSTFNEWMESTQIEPAVQYGDQYLVLTKQNADALPQRLLSGARGRRLEPSGVRRTALRPRLDPVALRRHARATRAHPAWPNDRAGRVLDVGCYDGQFTAQRARRRARRGRHGRARPARWRARGRVASTRCAARWSTAALRGRSICDGARGGGDRARLRHAGGHRRACAGAAPGWLAAGHDPEPGGAERSGSTAARSLAAQRRVRRQSGHVRSHPLSDLRYARDLAAAGRIATRSGRWTNVAHFSVLGSSELIGRVSPGLGHTLISLAEK